MLSKLKHIKDLRSQAKQLQDVLAEETVTVEKRGATVVMDGNQKVVSLTLPADMTAEQAQSLIPGLINDAMDKVKKIMAKKMQEMGGFPGLN